MKYNASLIEVFADKGLLVMMQIFFVDKPYDYMDITQNLISGEPLKSIW